MKFLLDTDHVTFLQQRAGPAYMALSARMARHPSADFAYSVVSFHEQSRDAHAFIQQARSTRQLLRAYRLLEETLQFYSGVTVLPFNAAAGAVFDNLVAQRIRVGTMDLRIASIAFLAASPS